MDNETAKTILSAYRPGGADAQDPRFAEALRHCERDPQAKAWFEDHLRRDREIAAALRQVPVPARGKQDLLATLEETLEQRGRARVIPFPRLAVWGALAAVLVLGLFLALPRSGPGAATNPAFAAAAVESLAGHDFNSMQVADMRDWLVARGAPAPGSLPAALAATEGIGCAVIPGPGGTMASIICVFVNGEEVHLVTYALPEPGEAQPLRVAREGSWNVAHWSDGERAFALVGTLPEEKLRTLLAG